MIITRNPNLSAFYAFIHRVSPFTGSPSFSSSSTTWPNHLRDFKSIFPVYKFIIRSPATTQLNSNRQVQKTIKTANEANGKRRSSHKTPRSNIIIEYVVYKFTSSATQVCCWRVFCVGEYVYYFFNTLYSDRRSFLLLCFTCIPRIYI